MLFDQSSYVSFYFGRYLCRYYFFRCYSFCSFESIFRRMLQCYLNMVNIINFSSWCPLRGCFFPVWTPLDSSIRLSKQTFLWEKRVSFCYDLLAESQKSFVKYLCLSYYYSCFEWRWARMKWRDFSKVAFSFSFDTVWNMYQSQPSVCCYFHEPCHLSSFSLSHSSDPSILRPRRFKLVLRLG